MRVRYTSRAFADREEIFAYIDQRNPRAAREIKAFIVRIIHIRHAARRPWEEE
jgi:plasmid stabilization system protein ParE